MGDTPDDLKVKISTSCAQIFVETYYAALNNAKSRCTLSSFYIKPTISSPAKAYININGNIISHPANLQALFETQIQKAHYEVQSYDAHVINSNYNTIRQNGVVPPGKVAKRISVILLISGSVKYWKGGEDGNIRGFTESVVLVPNPEAYESNANKASLRRWLISSQTFRLVV